MGCFTLSFMTRFFSQLLLFLCLLNLGTYGSLTHASNKPENPVANNTTPTILIMGDSLSAGFGINPADGWVALLEKKLGRENLPHKVVNASISGETTSGGLSRLPQALHTHQPEVVVIELGGNDGLRGLPLALMQKNLGQMIGIAQKSKARVLLIGMRLPPNYGPQYTESFSAMYLQLAKKYHVAVVPFLLAGVATHRELMQADGIHPLAPAQATLLDNVWPHLQPLLQDRLNGRLN